MSILNEKIYKNDGVKGIELYNNPSGTNGDVTLNDSVANYSYIEIYGYANGYYTSHKTAAFSGQNITIHNQYNIGHLLVITTTRYTLNGTSIIVDVSNSGYATINTSNVAGLSEGTNYFNITKVIGYK